MNPKRRYSVIRDPVHGDVYLSHEEISLLDTPEMQRLRGVKQLGTAYLVYPGAVHTRFDHSVGTLHATQRVIDAINLNFELEPRRTLGVGEEEARLIRVAALLHDVTHIPFGHNIEDQTGLLPRHDTRERYDSMLSRQSALGARLERLGMRRDVLSILAPDKGGSQERHGVRVPRYWSQVLADTICSDLFDYLLRDAYFTGLSLGVDGRLLNYFKIDRASGNLYIDLTKKRLLREDILSELVRMLEARYYFSERVYYHHAKVSAGAMVARAVELAMQAGALREEELYHQTDASLLARLEAIAASLGGETGRRMGGLVSGLQERRLLKRACVFPRYENAEAQSQLVARFFSRGSHAERADVEFKIADLLRFATGREVEIVLYCPAAHMQLKEVHTHVRWPGEEEVRPLADFAEHVPRLADLSRSYRNLWKFYVLADTRDAALLTKIQEITADVLRDATNVYGVEA